DGVADVNKYPKRSQAQVTGDRAADLLSLALTKVANVIEVPVNKDFGIDFICELFEDDLPSGKHFAVQCKGTSQIDEHSADLRWPVKVATVNYWLLQPMPVFLMLVDVQRKLTYWCYPKHLIQDSKNDNWQRQKSVTLLIPKQNHFGL